MTTLRLRKKPLIEGLKEIFSDFPIQFKTSAETKGLIAPDYDLWSQIEKKGHRNFSSTLDKALSTLREDNFIVRLKDLVNSAERKEFRNYLKFKFVTISKLDLSDAQKKVLKKARGLIYILNQNPQKIIKDFLESHRTELEEVKTIPSVPLTSSTSQEDGGIFETFEKQILFSSVERKDFSKFYRDMVTYLSSYFYRRCPMCDPDDPNAYYLLEPSEKIDIDFYDSIEDLNDFAVAYYDNERNMRQFKQAEKMNKTTTKLMSKLQNEILIIEEWVDEDEFQKEQQKIYELFYCLNDNCSFFLQSKKQNPNNPKRFHLFKTALFDTDKIVYEINEGLKLGEGIVLLGFPGDGKSSICSQILEYFYWRYNVPYIVWNTDESTTSYHLKGGFSPSVFAMGDITKMDRKEKIEYGIFPTALLSRGYTKSVLSKEGTTQVQIGKGANIFMDEVNRTDFRNIAFLMGYYADPYSFILKEDDNRVFHNPNALNRDSRWVSLFTMNTADIGNEDLSLAFKRRFHIIRVEFDLETQKSIIKSHKRLENDEDWRLKAVEKIFEETRTWAKQREVIFPAGIGHILKFINGLENGLRTLFELDEIEPEIAGKPHYKYKDAFGDQFTTKTMIELALKSHVIMPIVDENNPIRVEKLLKNMGNISILIDKDLNEDVSILEEFK